MVARDRDWPGVDLRDLDLPDLDLSMLKSPVLFASFSASSSSDIMACGFPKATFTVKDGHENHKDRYGKFSKTVVEIHILLGADHDMVIFVA